MQKHEKSKNGKLTHGYKDSRGPTVGNADQSPSARRATLSVVAGSQQSSSANAHGATGPRTPGGKKRSSRNALKSGIFSQAVVLNGESRAQYDTLLKGFRDYFQPVGLPEDLLVEKLVTLWWRHRRLLVAEGAEIRRSAEFVEWNHTIEQQQEAEQIEHERNSEYMEYRRPNPDQAYPLPGLKAKIENPVIWATCMQALLLLRRTIETLGFNEQHDVRILEGIYGNRARIAVRLTLFDAYRTWFYVSQVSEEERKRNGFKSPADCKQAFLGDLNLEIRRLYAFQNRKNSFDESRAELDRQRFNVPEPPALDRLIRYQASLDHSFDRTLAQLERLQRIRRGQTVPTVKVEVND